MPADGIETQSFVWGPHRFHNFWRNLLPSEMLDKSPPTEAHASCHSCPKVKSAEHRPGIKCCTYHPKVPNYMLGLSIRQDRKSRKRIENLSRQGFLLPEGSGHTPAQWLEVIGVGGSRGLKGAPCHFLDQGSCSIYAFRNSACTTYFCQLPDASPSDFWDALHHYMARLELALTQHCLTSLGFSFESYLKAFKKLSGQSFQDTCDPTTKAWKETALEELWQDWRGRESEFYLACGDLVEALAINNRLLKVAESVDLVDPNLIEISRLEADLSGCGDQEQLQPLSLIKKRLYQAAGKLHL